MPRSKARIAWCLFWTLFAASTQRSGSAADTEQQLLAEARQSRSFEWIVGVRRALHAIPELGFQEEQTSIYIRKQLDELRIPYRYPVAVTGITADIGNGTPVFVLRADMDALPIQEDNPEAEYSSRTPGLSHACGHDAHMAMLLGAARLLNSRKTQLQGTVRLIFQPAEESHGGAVDMMMAGALKDVAAVSAIHVWPSAPSGVIRNRPGTMLAARDTFECTITGHGGHGAAPHETIDPVIAAALTVIALQPLVSRETAPSDAAVVTVARFNTGDGAANVISDTVRLSGTLRAVTSSTVRRLRQRVEAVANATATAHGCSVVFTWEKRPYPATVNDVGLANLVAGVAGRLATFEHMRDPSMGAEDFAFMADEVPGVFTVLGIFNKSAGSIHEVHTTQFTMDEGQLPLGAALHAATALRWLEANGKASAAAAEIGDEL